MFYGSNVWDPGLIIAQIISVQCLFYISLGLIQAVTIGPTLGYITVAYIFDWGTLHFSTALGMLNWTSHVVNAIAGAAVLAWVVERAKKCLDFGATCYIWHTIFVCWYSGWPQSLAWWLATGSGLLIMVLLGEWLCVRREMQDIPLSVPQRLSSGLLSYRKESGQVVVPMMPLPTEDPDAPARPRLRTGLTTLQRSTAAAATTAAGSSTSFSPGPAGIATAAAPAATTAAAGDSSSSSSTPSQLPPAGTRPGSAVQLSPVQGASSSSSSVMQSGGSISRKKLQMRPASQRELGTAKQQQTLAGAGAVAGCVIGNGVVSAPGSMSGAAAGVAPAVAAPAAVGEVELA